MHLQGLGPSSFARMLDEVKDDSKGEDATATSVNVSSHMSAKEDKGEKVDKEKSEKEKADKPSPPSPLPKLTPHSKHESLTPVPGAVAGPYGSAPRT